MLVIAKNYAVPHSIDNQIKPDWRCVEYCKKLYVQKKKMFPIDPDIESHRSPSARDVCTGSRLSPSFLLKPPKNTPCSFDSCSCVEWNDMQYPRTVQQIVRHVEYVLKASYDQCTPADHRPAPKFMHPL
jgi:hypothetical protein